MYCDDLYDDSMNHVYHISGGPILVFKVFIGRSSLFISSGRIMTIQSAYTYTVSYISYVVLLRGLR